MNATAGRSAISPKRASRSMKMFTLNRYFLPAPPTAIGRGEEYSAGTPARLAGEEYSASTPARSVGARNIPRVRPRDRSGRGIFCGYARAIGRGEEYSAGTPARLVGARNIPR
eukprot:1504628-Pyramimonas_sp.AAC.1